MSTKRKLDCDQSDESDDSKESCSLTVFNGCTKNVIRVPLRAVSVGYLRNIVTSEVWNNDPKKWKATIYLTIDGERGLRDTDVLAREVDVIYTRSCVLDDIEAVRHLKGFSFSQKACDRTGLQVFDKIRASSLTLTSATFKKALATFKSLPCLRTLNLESCSQLTSEQNADQWPCVLTLFGFVAGIDGIGSCVSLRELFLSGCSKLTSVSEIDCCRND